MVVAYMALVTTPLPINEENGFASVVTHAGDPLPRGRRLLLTATPSTYYHGARRSPFLGAVSKHRLMIQI